MAGKLTVEVLTATVGKDGAKLWEKAETASIKVELRDGSELQKGKTTQVARKKDAAGGYSLTFNEVLDFDVNDKLSGELRVQLCRAKNSAVAGGTKPIANAGIYVEKIVGFIKEKKKQISKSFTMYAVEGGGNGGSVMLKLNFIPAGSSVPLGAALASAPSAAEEVSLGEHKAEQVDTSHDHVVKVKAHHAGPPFLLIGAVLLAVAGAAAVLLGGAGAAAPAPPAGKGKAAPAKAAPAKPAAKAAAPAKGKAAAPVKGKK